MNMKKIITLVFSVMGFLTAATWTTPSAHACPASVFTAKYNGKDLARIRGAKILDAGWREYSSKTTEDTQITRYAKVGADAALWLVERTDGAQPGIEWKVWYDHGMFEGVAATYQIQTNVRSIGGGEANVKLVDADHKIYQVNCR